MLRLDINKGSPDWSAKHLGVLLTASEPLFVDGQHLGTRQGLRLHPHEYVFVLKQRFKNENDLRLDVPFSTAFRNNLHPYSTPGNAYHLSIRVHEACRCKQEADCLLCGRLLHPKWALYVGPITPLDMGIVGNRSNNSLPPVHVGSSSIIKCRI